MKGQKNHHTLRYINKESICAEIGVWKGHLSREILQREPKELHLIDPWQSQDFKGRCYSIDQDSMDIIYEQVLEDFTYTPGVTIHRKFSTDVSFPEKYFDWVYIDANHDECAVLLDLEKYYPLMKKGGYLCGDDYGTWEAAGVREAVTEFVSKNDLRVEVVGDQFTIFVEC